VDWSSRERQKACGVQRRAVAHYAALLLGAVLVLYAVIMRVKSN